MKTFSAPAGLGSRILQAPVRPSAFAVRPSLQRVRMATPVLCRAATTEAEPLKKKRCIPCEGGISALPRETVDEYLQQCPGWTLGATADGHDCVQREWRVKSFSAGLKLFDRIGTVANEEKHHPDLHLVDYNRATVRMTTHASKGLTENDFIVAAKMNEVDVADLLSKKHQG